MLDLQACNRCKVSAGHIDRCSSAFEAIKHGLQPASKGPSQQAFCTTQPWTQGPLKKVSNNSRRSVLCVGILFLVLTASCTRPAASARVGMTIHDVLNLRKPLNEGKEGETKPMDLSYLAKLLLQHDDNPLVGSQDVHAALLSAAEEDRVKCAASPRGPGVAVVLDQRLVLVQQGQASGEGHRIGKDTIEFAKVVDPPEAITSLAWLAAPGQPAEDCLLLGTSSGHLQVHAPSGQLLQRLDLHDTSLVSIALRWGGMGLDPGALAEEVTICASGAVIRIPCIDLWALMRWHTGKQERGWWGVAPTPPTLSFSKWLLPKGTGPRTYALSLGAPLPPLYTVLTGRQQGNKLQFFTAGTNPPIVTLEADEAKSVGLLSLVSGLASSTAKGLLGRAKGALPAPRAGAAPAAARSGEGKGKRAKVPGDPSVVTASIWDEKRMVTRVSPSPCGTLAACCDNLGRVMLADMAATLVIRMLKGYRDAQVAWLVGPAGLQQRSQQRQQGAGGQQGPLPEQQMPLQADSSHRREAGGAAQELLSSPVDWEARWSESESGSEQQQLSAAQQGAEGAWGPGPPIEEAEVAGGGWQGAPRGRRQQRGPALSCAISPVSSSSGSSLGSALDDPWPPGEEDGEAMAAQEQQQQHTLPEPFQPHEQQQQQLPGEGQQGQQGGGGQQQEVYVVIYAPRRAAVELWQPRSGRRVGALRYPSSRGLLLQQPVGRAGRLAGLPLAPAGGATENLGLGLGPGQGAGPYERNAVWLLNLESLELVDLLPALLG